MTNRFVVIDIETTGNSSKKGDRIIQIAAIIVENEQIVDQYTTFVNPCTSIPVFIEELTGINDEMVKDAPLFEEIADDLLKILEGSIFVAHNVLFDLSFLQEEFKRIGRSEFVGLTIDTVELSRVLFPSSDSFKLFDLTESFSIHHERPHQADSDAFVTAKLLLHCINFAKELPLITLEQLSLLAVGLKSDIEVLFEAILHRKKKHIENLPEHLEVYRGIALRKKKKKHIERNYRERYEYPISPNEKEKLLSQTIKHFEVRDGQFEMMDIVYESLRLKKTALIEAGTGVGKSLAYLLPSLYQSVQENKPILISTYTVQLQEQLLQNEIKKLENMLPFAFKTVLLKGRQHYINLFMFEQSLHDEDTQYDEILSKMQILVWLLNTETGDIDEINLSSGGKLFWNRIKQGGWHLKDKDPWVSRDFYLNARKEAENADLVITNHAMMLIDFKQESSLFRTFDYVIIDEAHHFEKCARHFFGKKLEYIPCKYLCSKLGAFEKKQAFFQLEKLIDSNKITPKTPAFELDFSIIELERSIDELFLGIADRWMFERNKQGTQAKTQIRLVNKWMDESKWQPVKYCAEKIIATINEINSSINGRLTSLKRISEKLNEKEKAFVEEIYNIMNEFHELQKTIQMLLIQQSNDHVYWIEGDVKAIPNSITVQSQSISVKNQLGTAFFSKKKSTILTSATLTVNNSFSFFENELGLNHLEHLVKKQIPSPFHYKEMTKLIIPNDVPEILHVSSKEYAESISSHLIAIAQATKGRMLVLFTANEMLRQTHNFMKESGLLEDFVLIAQGITAGSRTRLIKNFQRFEKAILFGTNSFWEGVDIPGEDLSCLVIVRLPFSPPDEPYIWAKSKALTAEGKNPFTAYSLPEAVIRFKQGFGRLIRRDTDKGIVIVFDRRIDTTKYGKAFLQSLPKIPVKHASLKEIIEIVEKWF
ncbi:ATP-dependent DNA helicase DinG [Heyndrickxia sporothermodurans]|uniref:ATP-dependent DNA helicase DinG n=1 Tax=Heyndrickxia sporothermodurans TaxID=46224 RepID=UPI00192AA21B|nr:ATP-dependent DNA helicase DinG [Heyndrickxia sporothermodurans]MBL5831607.1 ATP-dependent DNA helicase DinG [Heyndrickxia sporothermodurans]